MPLAISQTSLGASDYSMLTLILQDGMLNTSSNGSYLLFLFKLLKYTLRLRGVKTCFGKSGVLIAFFERNFIPYIADINKSSSRDPGLLQ